MPVMSVTEWVDTIKTDQYNSHANLNEMSPSLNNIVTLQNNPLFAHIIINVGVRRGELLHIQRWRSAAPRCKLI